MLDPQESKHVMVSIVDILKGSGDPLMGFDTVIVSATTADEAVDAFRAGADGVMIGKYIIFRDQLKET